MDEHTYWLGTFDRLYVQLLLAWQSFFCTFAASLDDLFVIGVSAAARCTLVQQK